MEQGIAPRYMSRVFMLRPHVGVGVCRTFKWLMPFRRDPFCHKNAARSAQPYLLWVLMAIYSTEPSRDCFVSARRPLKVRCPVSTYRRPVKTPRFLQWREAYVEEEQHWAVFGSSIWAFKGLAMLIDIRPPGYRYLLTIGDSVVGRGKRPAPWHPIHKSDEARDYTEDLEHDSPKRGFVRIISEREFHPAANLSFSCGFASVFVVFE